MPATAHNIHQSTIHKAIKLLIHNLVHLKDTTGEFLLRLEDGRIIDTKGWDENNWEWTHGIGLYGIWQYHVLTGDPESLKIIEDWFRDRFAAGGTTKNINTMAVFLTLACLYEKTKNQTYLPWLDAWGEWAMYGLERTEYGGMQHVTYLTPNTQQLWDDTLMMTVLPLAKIGKVLDRPHYVEEAKRQFLLHIQYLFDAKTGLFHHGWTFEDGGHNFANAAWGRGNSWLTIAIPEFLDLLNLPTSDPLRLHLECTLTRQCRSLCKLQNSSGLWHTILTDSSAQSYPEASASAGFAFGMLKAARKRYLPSGSGGRDEFSAIAVHAIKAVLDNIDSSTGELGNVSFGTPVFLTKEEYFGVRITAMPYGQSMAMLALVEFLRVFL
ncbi:glycosyl hydrolase [Wilcoxina mikolae CBS 423.85]|nr:glycosyl hydrolase [Wilcoxina mikolae CBS 423.85]